MGTDALVWFACNLTGKAPFGWAVMLPELAPEIKGVDIGMTIAFVIARFLLGLPIAVLGGRPETQRYCRRLCQRHHEMIGRAASSETCARGDAMYYAWVGMRPRLKARESGCCWSRDISVLYGAPMEYPRYRYVGAVQDGKPV